jgi:hypothetical protein
MNYRGSYRHLLKNSKAAMLAAIEIYNKPRFDYRDECFVILLLNAWELVLKSLLSKNKKSVFYPKKRKQPYRTLSLTDALQAVEKFFPPSVPILPVKRNLELLSTYRDNAVHFYNAEGFGSLIYALAQTSIVNYRDLLEKPFGVDLGSEITWQLLPLGLRAPIDPIAYIAGKKTGGKGSSAAVRQFIAELAAATEEIEGAGSDTGRLLTVFTVNLQSTKKIEKADVVVGVVKTGEVAEGPLAIVKSVDPNVSHPLRQKEVLETIGTLHGRKFTSHAFQALSSHKGWKDDPRLCWRAKEGVLTKYSNDLVPLIKQVSASELGAALKSYRERPRKKRSGT